MRKIVTWVILGVFIILILSACSQNQFSEDSDEIKQLKADFWPSSRHYLQVTGCELQDLTVIKRLTDEAQKKDTVYVQVTLDHPNAIVQEAYVMNYTLYNDGWRLDSMNRYEGNDAIWSVESKGIPDGEVIIRAMDSKSESYRSEWYLPKDQYIRYFEEGKYRTQIYPGIEVTSGTYSCLAETERVFNYVTVKQVQLLRFTFDTNYYEWCLDSDEIVDVEGRWYLGQKWVVPSNGVEVSLIPRYSNAYTCEGRSGQRISKDDFELPLPTSRWINMRGPTIDFFPTTISINITPDSVRFYDYSIGGDLEPVGEHPAPPQLEETGLIVSQWDPRAEDYFKVIEELIEEMVTEYGTSGDYYRKSAEIYTRDAVLAEGGEEIFEHMSQIGIDTDSVEELAMCTMWVIEPEELEEEQILLVKVNGEIVVVPLY